MSTLKEQTAPLLEMFQIVVMSMKGTPGLSRILKSMKFAPRNYFDACSKRAANSVEIE